jgi:hypothetical protein
VAVVDAETFVLLERTTTEPGGEIAQAEVFRTEYLPAGSPRVRLSMAKHPCAKVRRVTSR